MWIEEKTNLGPAYLLNYTSLQTSFLSPLKLIELGSPCCLYSTHLPQQPLTIALTDSEFRLSISSVVESHFEFE